MNLLVLGRGRAAKQTTHFTKRPPQGHQERATTLPLQTTCSPQEHKFSGRRGGTTRNRNEPPVLAHSDTAFPHIIATTPVENDRAFLRRYRAQIQLHSRVRRTDQNRAGNEAVLPIAQDAVSRSTSATTHSNLRVGSARKEHCSRAVAHQDPHFQVYWTTRECSECSYQAAGAVAPMRQEPRGRSGQIQQSTLRKRLHERRECYRS